MLFRPILACATAFFLALPLAAQTGERGTSERLAGPIPAEVLHVVDGDTLEVSARIWLGQIVVTRVRILGIDTPEMKGKCERERELAREAKRFAESWLATRPRLALRDINRDKYGDRVVARITSGDEDLGDALLAAGLAYAYGGKTKSGWCNN